MKVTKRFLLTLAAVIGMTGVWAEVNDTGDEVPVTATGNTNEWTLTMPASNVEVEVEYDTSLEFATLTTAPTAVSNLIYSGEPQTLVTAGTATNGTLSYGFGTAEAAPAPGTWSADIPTATDAGTYYVWYRVLGDDTHNGVAAAGPLTVKILTSAKVGLTMTGNSGTGSTASLLKYADGTFVPLASTDIIKEGDKFVLYVNKTDGYDFGVTLSTGDLATNVQEFSEEDYQKYADYAKAQGIAVPLSAVLAWVTMPYVESGDLAVTVNFKQPKTYTVLYRPTGTASEVWCRIGMDNAFTGMHYDAVKMKNDTQVGDQQAWAAKILAADAPTKVAFFTTEAAAKADGAAMSNATVSQSASTWTTIGSGSDKYLMIGGNAKTVVAAFVTDGSSMPVYDSSTATLSGSTSTTSVTYRLAVCPTGENGNVTSAGSVTTFAPTAPKGKQFLNWSVLEGTAPNKTDKRYDANENVSIRENTIFTAVWKPITVAATLNLNGGTGIDNTSAVDYNNALSISTPTRQGFVFNGWTVNKTVTENGQLFGKGSPFDLSTPLTANLGLTAQWKHVHAYKGYKISDFGSALSAYQKYESVLHVAVCSCNDIKLEAHTFSASGKCIVCGYTKPGSTKVTLDVSYGVWTGGNYTEKMKGFPQEGLQKNQEVTVSAPGWLGSNLEFQKWQYSTDGTHWYDLAAYDYVSFLIPCNMTVRALYVNPVTQPQVELSARQYDDKAVVGGQTYTMDNVLYQMNYKLPDGCTLLDAGIRMGDNQGISYYELKERIYTMDAEAKAIGVGICTVTSILGGDINTFDASASEKYYAKRENSVLDEMSAATLAEYMMQSKPVNVEKYPPIYWEAKAPTKALNGSMATMPPLRFIQKNNGQHYIYGIGYMRYKDALGYTKTIYTDALPVTRDNIPANSVTKTADGQNAPARRAAASVLRRDGDNTANDPIDMSLVLAPETQLTVYVDGKWSDALSNSYGYGENATITAPATVDGKNFAYWEADGQPVSSNSTLTLTMNANTTLRAVYDGSAPQNAGVGLTSVTRSSDGSKISLQAIADAQATEAGIIYSTSASGDALTIGGTGVTQVAAETITDATAELPQSVLDQNKNWMLQIKAADETTVYHVRAYATISGTTVYSDVKDVTLAGLESGIQRIANLGGFEQDIDDAVENVANQIEEALDRITVTIPAKSFVTRCDTGNRQMETSVSGVTLHSVQSATSTQVQLTDAIGVVAAEMPYMIYNDNDVESSVSMVKSTESADQVTYDSQHFKGTLAAKSVTADDMTSNDYYICTGKAFVWVKDAGNIPANKAWIQLPKNSNARKLNIVFGDATGIGQLDNLTISRLDNWYDLSGRKLQGRPTEKGVYIRNGKKVVVN